MRPVDDHDVARNTQAPEHLAQADGLGEAVLDFALNDEKVKVAIGAMVATRTRTEEKDLRRGTRGVGESATSTLYGLVVSGHARRPYQQSGPAKNSDRTCRAWHVQNPLFYEASRRSKGTTSAKGWSVEETCGPSSVQPSNS